jgi:hypothetical protein
MDRKKGGMTTVMMMMMMAGWWWVTVGNGGPYTSQWLDARIRERFDPAPTVLYSLMGGCPAPLENIPFPIRM